MQRPDPPLFFVHVPKTAGTSFRIAAEQHFGREHCAFDYGSGIPETSALVQRLGHDAPDLYALLESLTQARCRLLGGHVAVARYAPLVGCDRVVSILREPAAQLMSHFAHLNRAGSTRALPDFLSGPQGAGLQTAMLAGPPLEALGPVGLTERYADSLMVLNAALGTAFQSLRLNQNPARASAEELSAVPDGQAALVEAAAQRDRPLYRRASRLLSRRLDALRSGYAFVNGMLQQVAPRRVAGFAFLSGSDEPVQVRLSLNGRSLAVQAATADRPLLRQWGAPRCGLVGFDFAAPAWGDDDAGEISVAETGQLLGRFGASAG